MNEVTPFKDSWGPRTPYSPTMTVLSSESVEDIAQRTAAILGQHFGTIMQAQDSEAAQTASAAALFIEMDILQAFWRLGLFILWLVVLVLWLRGVFLTLRRLWVCLGSRRGAVEPYAVPVAVAEKIVAEDEV